MAAAIIDGKAAAAEVRERVTVSTAAFVERAGRPPGLVGVQVGDDPASEVYQRMKEEAARACGMSSRRVVLPAGTTQAELDALIDELNADPAVDGMLVQLPVPEPLTEPAIAARIDPEKEVDGFSPVNLGRLMRGEPGLVPCTPTGVMWLLESAGVELQGARAIVIGRSLIVGKPVALLLLQRHATVTLCHSRTRDLRGVVREGDVVIAAVGRARLVGREWVKPGAAVIDVGVNAVGSELVGDVDFEGVQGVASLRTPPRGGVGPMTITMLLRNTLEAHLRRTGAHAA